MGYPRGPGCPDGRPGPACVIRGWFDRLLEEAGRSSIRRVRQAWGQTMELRRKHRGLGLLGKGRAALTLFESLVAVLLVGIAATAFCSALVAGTHQNQAAVQYVVATDLAAALMNEIVAKPFADPDLPLVFTPGLEAGEVSRIGTDNIDDYHNQIEDAGGLRAFKGAFLAAGSLSKYIRSATASYVNMPGRNPALGPGFVLVTVEVKYDGVSLVKITRLISSEERR